ncbi:hypothetical protein KGP36_03195 [Patescibacteria group bacterium]|nr:hypothetical protein [Patescibacteria group bacterium]
MKYYIYKHIDPFTGECVYVGQGSGGRAWVCSGARSEEHSKWMSDLLSLGITPDKWVEIVDSNTSKKEVQKIEHNLIHKLEPKFNKNQRVIQTKVSKDEYLEMVKLRQLGKTYKQISEELGWSLMCVHHHLNGKTIHE